MKKLIYIASIFFASVAVSSCDDGFVEVNTNPYALTKIDPALLFHLITM